jgi:hypothetical protein
VKRESLDCARVFGGAGVAVAEGWCEVTAVVITPAVLEHRIGILTAAWNELRNYALGRGLKPRVSARTADVVGKAYEAWRAALDGFGAGGLLIRPSTASQTDDWYRRYNALRDVVESERPGAPPPITDSDFGTVAEALRGAVQSNVDEAAAKLRVEVDRGVAEGKKASQEVVQDAQRRADDAVDEVKSSLFLAVGAVALVALWVGSKR